MAVDMPIDFEREFYHTEDGRLLLLLLEKSPELRARLGVTDTAMGIMRGWACECEPHPDMC